MVVVANVSSSLQEISGMTITFFELYQLGIESTDRLL